MVEPVYVYLPEVFQTYSTYGSGSSNSKAIGYGMRAEAVGQTVKE